MEPATAC